MANTIEIIGSWPSGETEYVIGTENPSRLPPVSDADNGDVLTVVNGAWKDAAPTGGGGGGGLPPVTADDNGDVLTVVDGAWDKAAPSGGGGGLLVNMIWDEAESQYTLSKNYQEIATALQNGIMPIFNDNDIDSAVYTLYYLVSCGYEDDVQMYGVTIMDIINPMTEPLTFHASTTTGELVYTDR